VKMGDGAGERAGEQSENPTTRTHENGRDRPASVLVFPRGEEVRRDCRVETSAMKNFSRPLSSLLVDIGSRLRASSQHMIQDFT
jgi:hypothetical protein